MVRSGHVPVQRSWLEHGRIQVYMLRICPFDDMFGVLDVFDKCPLMYLYTLAMDIDRRPRTAPHPETCTESTTGSSSASDKC